MKTMEQERNEALGRVAELEWFAEFERWEHVKTGTVYRLIGHATLEHDLTYLVLYRRDDDPSDARVWARPQTEFSDKRFGFVKLEAPNG